MEKYEYFASLALKKRFGAEDKKAIVQEAETLGISLDRTCSNCLHDAAVQIALYYKPKGSPEEQRSLEGYVLHDGIDITLESYKHGRLHVCAKNCTEANAKLWIAAGIPTRFFKHLPDEGNE